MRKKLLKWHSVSALVALIPMMIIAITGSVLVFKVEIDTWLMPEHMSVSAETAHTRLNLNTLIERVTSTHSDFLMGSWELFDDKSRADTAYIIKKTTGDWYKLYLDQYTGKLLSSPVTVTHDITGTVLGSIFAIILLFLGISGIILYRQFWKKLFTLRFKAAKRIFYSDVHKLIGITSSPVLIILAITGGYFNIAAVVHEVSEHIEAHPLITHPLYNDNLDFQHLMDKSQQDIKGYKPTYFIFPFEPDLHTTGSLMSAYDIRDAPLINIVVDTFRKLHFGYFAGLPSKIVWCVLGLTPLWLSLTGLYFYWFRTRKKNRRKAYNHT